MVRFLRSSSRIRLTRSYTLAPESEGKAGRDGPGWNATPGTERDDGQLINGGLWRLNVKLNVFWEPCVKLAEHCGHQTVRC